MALRSDPFPILSDTRRLSPAQKVSLLTFSGSPDQDYVLPEGICKGLWINDTGVVIVSVVAEDNSSAVLMSVNGPGLLPVRVYAIRPNQTTATSVVAMY